MQRDIIESFCTIGHSWDIISDALCDSDIVFCYQSCDASQLKDVCRMHDDSSLIVHTHTHTHSRAGQDADYSQYLPFFLYFVLYLQFLKTVFLHYFCHLSFSLKCWHFLVRVLRQTDIVLVFQKQTKHFKAVQFNYFLCIS